MTAPPASVRARLADRAWWRLTRHFFGTMFDFGVLSEAGADSLKHLFAGSIGGFVAAAWLVVVIYADKYLVLWLQPTAEPYRRALLGDDLFMMGAPMLVGAFVTLTVGGALFPDERDFRILGPLPVRRRVIFGAKMAALALFVTGFVAVTLASIAPLFLLTTRNPWGEHVFGARLLAWLVASAAASTFAILAVAAATGVLGLSRTTARLQAVTTTLKCLALGTLVLCVPAVPKLSDAGGAMADGAPWLLLVPPAWFVGLERVLTGSARPWFTMLAGLAIAALTAAAVVVVALYAALFRHFERLVLRPPTVAPARRQARGLRASSAPPGYLAVRLFVGATLRRSALHQGVLVGLAGCGGGIALNGVVGGSGTDAAIWAPFAVMFACGLGVRASLVLPIEHRANWLFRTTEDEGTRADQLRAMDDIATAVVVVPAVAASLPVLWPPLGLQTLAAAVAIATVGLVTVHAVLLDWRRIPFTCSYLPGKRFVAQSFFLGVGAFTVFVLSGEWLLRRAISSPWAAIAIVGMGVAAGWLLRRRRLEEWSRRPLAFEDEFPDAVMALQLTQ
jgi:hypothetical protein